VPETREAPPRDPGRDRPGRARAERVEDHPGGSDDLRRASEGEAGGDQPRDLAVPRVGIGMDERERVAGEVVRSVPGGELLESIAEPRLAAGACQRMPIFRASVESSQTFHCRIVVYSLPVMSKSAILTSLLITSQISHMRFQ